MDLQTVDRLLTTTRSVRKRLDFGKPVPNDVIQRCIEIAMQSPTASNTQHWGFMVVTDPEKRALIADAYRRAFDVYAKKYSSPAAEEAPKDAHGAQMSRIVDSAVYLAEHLHEVPVFIICCVKGRYEHEPPEAVAAAYGSILPAAWSLMLALRARGLGSAWTTLHIMHEKDVAKALGMPDDITQAVLLPVAYFIGDDFKQAVRKDASASIHWNSWDRHTP